MDHYSKGVNRSSSSGLRKQHREDNTDLLLTNLPVKLAISDTEGVERLDRLYVCKLCGLVFLFKDGVEHHKSESDHDRITELPLDVFS